MFRYTRGCLPLMTLLAALLACKSAQRSEGNLSDQAKLAGFNQPTLVKSSQQIGYRVSEQSTGPLGASVELVTVDVEREDTGESLVGLISLFDFSKAARAHQGRYAARLVSGRALHVFVAPPENAPSESAPAPTELLRELERLEPTLDLSKSQLREVVQKRGFTVELADSDPATADVTYHLTQLEASKDGFGLSVALYDFTKPLKQRMAAWGDDRVLLVTVGTRDDDGAEDLNEAASRDLLAKLLRAGVDVSANKPVVERIQR